MFKERSSKAELLDLAEIPQQDLFLNLEELDYINKNLGGHKVSLDGLRKIILKVGKKELSLVDIGCGGGDSLRSIERWSRKNNIRLKLSGIDLKEDCILFCNLKASMNSEINYFVDDYMNISEHVPDIDIIHAALFCHHLNEKDIVELIEFSSYKKAILVINDLERNPIAYFAIKLLTKLFSKSYLVKNDAPLSVLRGFKKIEWKDILKKAGAKKYSIENKWAFRHQIIVYPHAK